MTNLKKALIIGSVTFLTGIAPVLPALAKSKGYGLTKPVFHINESGKVELKGGEVLSTDTTAKTMRVKIWGMEWTISTDEKTKLSPDNGGGLTLADIKAGDRVKVKGQVKLEMPMTILASHILDYSAKIMKKEMKGKIASVDATAKTFVLETKGRSVTVVVTDTTRIEDEEGSDFGLSNFADLTVGDEVEVKGLYDARTNTLTATKVEIEGEPEDED